MNTENYSWKIHTGNKISECAVTVSETVPNDQHSCVVSFSPGFKYFADINYLHLPCGRTREDMMIQGKVRAG